MNYTTKIPLIDNEKLVNQRYFCFDYFKINLKPMKPLYLRNVILLYNSIYNYTLCLNKVNYILIKLIKKVVYYIFNGRNGFHGIL